MKNWRVPFLAVPCLLSSFSGQFTDVTAPAGLSWKHENAASERKYIIETMGSGGAWIDYDGDGWLDLFFVNGGPTPARKFGAAPKHGLFRNTGGKTFTNVTLKAGITGKESFGMGAAAGDYDNDGFTDLFISGYPHSTLYRNTSKGTFTDVTAQAGVANRGRFGASAGWFDYDRDGYPDLLVLNYLDWSYEKDRACGDPARGLRQYCHPDNYARVSPVLYQNQRNGTFKDVTQKAGLAVKGKGLGLVLADFNADGWPDVFIANDGIENFLFFNRKDGTFEDASLASGVAYSEDGLAEAGMGCDAADIFRDGTLALYVTHLEFQRNRLYRYQGPGRFIDFTAAAGLARGRNLFSGFGTRFLDYDNDGWKDLLVINGHILDNISRIHPDVEYAERKLMFRNLGHGKFEDVSAQLGTAFAVKQVGRGLMVADFDNDGDLDFATTNNGGFPELIRNDVGNRNSWVQLRLQGRHCNRDAVGARAVVRTGTVRQMDEIKGGTSYLSSGDLRLHFGLGSARVIDEVRLTWPCGKTDTSTNLTVRRQYTWREGEPLAR